MKKWLMIAALWVFIIGTAIEEVKIFRKLKEIRKLHKEAEESIKELENLRKQFELEKTKWVLNEDGRVNDIEVARIKRLIKTCDKVVEAKTEKELDEVLTDAVKSGVIKEPWTGDFEEFMHNPENQLKFD